MVAAESGCRHPKSNSKENWWAEMTPLSNWLGKKFFTGWHGFCSVLREKQIYRHNSDKNSWALAGVTQLGFIPCIERLLVWLLVRAHSWVSGSGASQSDVLLSHGCFSPSPSLKINKNFLNKENSWTQGNTFVDLKVFQEEVESPHFAHMLHSCSLGEWWTRYEVTTEQVFLYICVLVTWL